MGEGRSHGQHDLALLVGLALHDRARRLGRRRPLDLLDVGRLPGPGAARADLIRPAPLTRAQRRPRISARGRCGTFRLSTVRTGAATSSGMSATARSAADSHGSGSSPDAQRDGERADPQLAGGQRRADRAGVEHGAAHVDAVVDAGEHEVGLGPDRPEGAGDDREGGGGIEPVGLHRLGALDVGPLVGDGRVIGHRADGGTGAAVVGARRHHDDLVGRVAARPRRPRPPAPS